MDNGAPNLQPASGLFRFQRMGGDGPVYEVLGPSAKLGMIRIYVFDTEEEVDYPLAEAAEDQRA